MEDDDLTALGLRAEPRGQLVHQYPVAPLQGVLHRVGRDRERLHQEGLDQQGQQQGDTDEERKLLPERTLRARLGALVLRVVLRELGIAPHGVVRPLLALVASGSCAYRHIPHIHSLTSEIAARAGSGTGPPLP